MAVGDWLKYHHDELKHLFQVERIPSYSAIRRVLLRVDYQDYASRLQDFFGVKPERGETISLDGKTLKGSYLVQEDNPESEPHPALSTAYVVERGLILPPLQVDYGSNEITAIPELIKNLAVTGVVFTFDAINTQKNSSDHSRNQQPLPSKGEILKKIQPSQNKSLYEAINLCIKAGFFSVVIPSR